MRLCPGLQGQLHNRRHDKQLLTYDNGMAESFVKTMKHNYVAFMDKPDAPTALSRLAIAFEHYNERHPHKALKYRSPREFRRAAVPST